ncbi:flagellar hook-length control protein FliK [Acidihalobacter ferrooxydans]|uniref:Flagellar hook-length control protein-like C-terminal domain-containing protein n=1 Tax=Acidihalobacter ferrooxydans TaxID=1765967 RepID=A0A1P8UGP0_9GAMM|nr:flagellar hook-length control protein FliK [Acidihalobacter ferrooxydans]APZ43006.1 hypothetical protein BW247_07805 [Acidihalobacter ferrooxydans]
MPATVSMTLSAQSPPGGKVVSDARPTPPHEGQPPRHEFAKAMSSRQAGAGEAQAPSRAAAAPQPGAPTAADHAGKKISTHKTKDGKDLPPEIVLPLFLSPLPITAGSKLPRSPSDGSPAAGNAPSPNDSQIIRAELFKDGALQGSPGAKTAQAATDVSARLEANIPGWRGLLASDQDGTRSQNQAPAAPMLAGTAPVTPPGASGASLSSGALPALALNQPGFSQALSERVLLMSEHQGRHLAQIQLNPPELGPMQIQIKVDGHHTQVLFHTQHSAVAEALDASLPKLREMLAQGGQQVSVSVQQQAGGWQGMGGQGQQQGYRSPQPWGSVSATWTGVSLTASVLPEHPIGLARWLNRSAGAIDAYV